MLCVQSFWPNVCTHSGSWQSGFFGVSCAYNCSVHLIVRTPTPGRCVQKGCSEKCVLHSNSATDMIIYISSSNGRCERATWKRRERAT